MKNILTILTLMFMMLLASCSTDILNVTEDGEGDDLHGTLGSIPAIEVDDNSRSSLYLLNGKMKFEWNTGDAIAVYPLYVEGTNQLFDGPDQSIRQVLTFLDGSAVDNTNDVRGSFTLNGASIYLLDVKNTKDFVAWSPYLADADAGHRPPEMDYRSVPVDYENQIQTANAELGHYITDDADEMAMYVQSEKNASAHLGRYDFMYSRAQQYSNGTTVFNFNHLQATVRLYMFIPEEDKPQVFDSLVVFHKYDAGDTEGYNFVTSGHFNLDSQEMTIDKQAYKMKLKLGSATEGLDLIDHDDLSDTYGEYKPIYKRNGHYVLVAYMQIYPVDMTSDYAQFPTLYLCGHTGSGDDMKINYYKARLAKKKLKAGKLYQWTMSDVDEDTPIEFEVVSVQEWKDDVAFYNTVDKQEGMGTEDW